ncbi:MAG TPA: hypothetical protein VHM19_14140 [Polyangiales bacterium]|jgi:hypothetical protein|nr:hypothetical protein [Polyangiales bacterium]
MMLAKLLLLATLHGVTPDASPQPRALTLTPMLGQSAVLYLSNDVTAGGAGGTLGVELGYRGTYLARFDAGMLWLLGNAGVARLALGLQHDGPWAPAVWLTFGVLWGERLEFLHSDGTRPALPSWSIGVRGSPLRFVSETGTFSALEPGIGSDLSGGVWLELGVLQVGLRF